MFFGGLESRGSSMPFFQAWTSKPDAVVERVFVDPESSEGSEFFFLPILLKRARFCRVSGAGSEVGGVVRARFARGSSSSSLSSSRFRDGGFVGTCSSWVGGSSACESSGEVCFLSMVKNERKGDFVCS